MCRNTAHWHTPSCSSDSLTKCSPPSDNASAPRQCGMLTIPQEACHEIRRRTRQPILLSRAAVSAAGDTPQKHKLSADIGSSTETKSFRRSSDEPISVRAVLGSGFKKCCMLSGHYDGSRRNYFFPRIETVNPARGDIAPCGRLIGMRNVLADR